MSDKYKNFASTIGALVDEKQAAYGDSFNKSGEVLKILYPNGVPVEAFTDMLAINRVTDKLFRIATRKDAFGESPWKDIAGYALLAAYRDSLLQEKTKETSVSPDAGEGFVTFKSVVDPFEDDRSCFDDFESYLCLDEQFNNAFTLVGAVDGGPEYRVLDAKNETTLAVRTGTTKWKVLIELLSYCVDSQGIESNDIVSEDDFLSLLSQYKQCRYPERKPEKKKVPEPKKKLEEIDQVRNWLLFKDDLSDIAGDSVYLEDRTATSKAIVCSLTKKTLAVFEPEGASYCWKPTKNLVGPYAELVSMNDDGLYGKIEKYIDALERWMEPDRDTFDPDYSEDF